MVDTIKKTSNVSPNSANMPAEAPAVAEKDKAWAEKFTAKTEEKLSANDSKNKADTVKPNDKEKKEAAPNNSKLAGRVAFNLTNFLGMHWVLNSTLSLLITYNILTKDSAKTFMSRLTAAAKPLNKGWNAVMTPIRDGMEKIGLRKPDEAWKALSAAEREASQAYKVEHGARSFVETLCMCIAGSIILIPVKWLENHHTQFVDAVDNFLHPSHKEANAKAREQEKNNPQPHKEKETWFNLIRTRLVALVPIFWIDGIVTQSTTNRIKAGKPNVDSFLWKKGAQLHANDQSSRVVRWVNKVLPEGWTTSVANFFSRKNVTVDSIQPMQLPDIANAIDAPQPFKAMAKEIATEAEKEKLHFNNPTEVARIRSNVKRIGTDFLKKNPDMAEVVERAVFAEQTRIFSKEIYLTGIYTVLLFVIGKTKFVRDGLNKLGSFVGLSEKPHKEEKSLQTQQKEPAPIEVDNSKETWVARTEKHDVKKEKVPTASFAEAAMQSQGQEAAVSL